MRNAIFRACSGQKACVRAYVKNERLMDHCQARPLSHANFLEYAE